MRENDPVSHRTSKLRGLQDKYAKHIPKTLRRLDSLGAFPGTRIHDVMENRSGTLQADDITLSQLQMTAYICRTIEQNKIFPSFAIEYILTCLLNGADGPVARRLGTVSNEGGIKDAAVDRLSEVMIANLITREMELPEDLGNKLQVSFQLSTLTKAACAMCSVKTSEGGLGSMIQRRVMLYYILRDIKNLKHIPKSIKPIREKLINNINDRIKLLIDVSFERAKERIRLISGQVPVVSAPDDHESFGASEARKYAGVVLLNNRIGIDIVDELNKLAEGSVIFPSVESLIENQSYIAESLTKAQGFLNEALSIAGFVARSTEQS